MTGEKLDILSKPVGEIFIYQLINHDNTGMELKKWDATEVAPTDHFLGF